MKSKKKKEWNLSDAKDMTPLNKGEILYYHKMGKKPKEISGLTGRSMEWIKLLTGALTSWRGQDKLINLYIDKLCKKESYDGQITTKSKSRPINGSTAEVLTQEEDGFRVQGTSGLPANRNVHNKRTTRPVSKRNNSRRKVQPRQSREPRSTSTGEQGIAAKSRKHKDYKGD